MTINQLTDDELSGIGLGPEHGPAKDRINSVISKVNAMDTPSEFEFTPSDVTDWGATAPTNLQEALDILASRNDGVVARCPDLPVQTDESEVTGTLNGDSSKSFTPEAIIVKVISASGTVGANGTLNVGTSTGGADILSAQALTGLDVAGETRRFPLAAATYGIAGNATLYANVEAADTTATTLVVDVYVVGKQF